MNATQALLTEAVKLSKIDRQRFIAEACLKKPELKNEILTIHARQRLMREARTAAALTHPHIATLYDVVEDGSRTRDCRPEDGRRKIGDRTRQNMVAPAAPQRSADGDHI